MGNLTERISAVHHDPRRHYSMPLDKDNEFG